LILVQDVDSFTLQKRFMASSSQSTFNRETQSILATGGYTNNNGETLSSTGWSLLTSGVLPVTIDTHCSAVINLTATIMVGGYQNNRISANTYIFQILMEIGQLVQSSSQSVSVMLVVGSSPIKPQILMESL